MSSKLLINVNDTRTVVPDTGDDTPSGAGTPDTGGNTILAGTNYVNDNGTSMVLPILGISLLVLLIITAIITTTIRRHKTNKAGKFSINNTKRLIAKVTTLSAVVLVAIFATVNMSSKQEPVGAVIDTTAELTISASDVSFDVDLGDDNAFGIGEGTVSIKTATKAGYTLMAYVDSTSTALTSKTNSSSTIEMLDSLEPQALAKNTWGIATTEPTSQDDAVFTGLPTSSADALAIKTTYRASEADEAQTFYYGAYLAPGLEYGAYDGVTITYVAVATFCNSEATTIDEAVCLQDFAGSHSEQIIDSMTPETTYTLFDKRDEKAYTVAKLLADGGDSAKNHYTVWMTQNLDLDLDSNTTYTNEDTDLGYNPRTGQYTTASWRPERSTTKTAGKWGRERDGERCWDIDDSSCGYYYSPQSYDPGDTYWNGRISDGADWWDYWRSCGNDYNPDCYVTIPTANYISNTGSSHYHLGNYYNWTAAIAMNDSESYFQDYDSYKLMEQSICPAGWTLPRIGSGEDSFVALWLSRIGNYDDETESYDNISALWSEPLSFPTSGYYMGAIGSVGIYGGFWSAVAYGYGSVNGFGGYDVSGPLFPEYFGSPYGLSVRCIARPVSPGLVL